jgi:hypothetical protein
MRWKFLMLPFGFLLAAAAGADDAKLETGKRPAAACHGTAVDFVGTPVEAAQLAREEKKLVMVLHVSGYFEDPTFT